MIDRAISFLIQQALQPHRGTASQINHLKLCSEPKLLASTRLGRHTNHAKLHAMMIIDLHHTNTPKVYTARTQSMSRTNPCSESAYSIYATPPNKHIPTPVHHIALKLILCVKCGSNPLCSLLTWCAWMFSGTSYCSVSLSPSSRLTLPVGAAAAVVGFIVTVGNICGGEYARKSGWIGVPSNVYRSSRVIFVYGSL